MATPTVPVAQNIRIRLKSYDHRVLDKSTLDLASGVDVQI